MPAAKRKTKAQKRKANKKGAEQGSLGPVAHKRAFDQLLDDAIFGVKKAKKR